MPARVRILPIALALVFCFQIAFWYGVRRISSFGVIGLTSPPSSTMLDLMALGDKQLLFRMLAFSLQTAGDQLGQFSEVDSQDYSALKDWLAAVSLLDVRSGLLPVLASSYYSSTKVDANLLQVIDYLTWYAANVADVSLNGKSQWRWKARFFAAFLAFSRLKDADLAIDIASQIYDVNLAPIWARFFAVSLMFNDGQYCKLERALRDTFLLDHEAEIAILAKTPDFDLSEQGLRFLRRIRYMEERSSALCLDLKRTT